MSCDRRPDATRVRFDDLIDDTSLVFGTPTQVLATDRLAEVETVLGRVEGAVEAGRWAAGFVAYEAAPALDAALAVAADPPPTPLVWFAIFDQPERGTALSGLPADEAYACSPWSLRLTRETYRQRIETVRDWIARGETYQCNFTDRLTARVTGSPGAFYSALVGAQRTRYAALVETPDLAVASASPELFFDLSGRTLTTRPMKGTAARSSDPGEDGRRRTALLASSKERAENVMIVDLLRNDLGKLAVPGTVRVSDLLTPEAYETVWQLTSTITAEVAPTVGLTEILTALFPCGSVTGAPKPRTMELITALEEASRGVYCGVIGWLAPPSEPTRARFSVAIRTVTIDRTNGAATYGAGGGITWPSRADTEFDELHHKAAVLAPTVDGGVSLLETMYVGLAGVRNASLHRARLLESAAALGYPVPVAELDRVLAARRDPAGVLRLTLSPDGSIGVTERPLPPPRSEVVLALDTEPVDSASPWLAHKTTHRVRYEQARDRQPDVDDVLLFNEHGHLTETTIATVAVRLDGTWCTPPLSAGCLPGTERARLVADGTLTERDVAVAELTAAEALAVLSSVRGWTPARLVAP